MADERIPKSKAKTWLSWLTVAALVLAAYFINVEVQTRLGEKALAETGLTGLSLQEALSTAQKPDKKVLVNMSAIWCPTCRKLDKEVFGNAAVKAAINKNYVFSRIEYESEEGEKFMEKYQVHGFPTLLILDTNGKKIKQLDLLFNPQDFIQQL